MKTRSELIEEIIFLERTAAKFKKGLHLAKKFIDSSVCDNDVTDEMAENFYEYDKHLDSHGLQGV